MGGRLSKPKGPAGTTEASTLPAPTQSQSTSRSRSSQRRMYRRQLVVPFAAVTLGTLFFIYSRTSIQSAKENARRHREADGGTISWRNEALRRHGVLEKPAERSVFSQIFSGKEDDAAVERRTKEAKRLESLARDKRGAERNPIEEGIRRARSGEKDEGG